MKNNLESCQNLYVAVSLLPACEEGSNNLLWNLFTEQSGAELLLPRSVLGSGLS